MRCLSYFFGTQKQISIELIKVFEFLRGRARTNRHEFVAFFFK
jgi:hypothetical protein